MHQEDPAPIVTSGRILHGAVGYDLLVWLRTLGRTTRFRRRLLDLARVTTGERLLDVGCGTGSLALEAKRRVGPGGTVSGFDPSPEMIARARRKARRAGLDVTFDEGAAERLPCDDGQFDVVTSTLMLHHLPKPLRATSIAEMARVLKPGGRLLVVDFGSSSEGRRTFLGHFHRHGHTKIDDIVALLASARLDVIESGPAGMNDLNFARATRPAGGVR